MHPLVDAFWKGRTALKKTKGEYFDNENKPKSACFIGAMHYGLFKKTAEAQLVVNNIEAQYPQIRYYTEPPCEHDNSGRVVSILIHLNDYHTMGDKKIADWLEEALAKELKEVPND